MPVVELEASAEQLVALSSPEDTKTETPAAAADWYAL
jgi:hypothetical protein